ncbi:MAG: GDSL-type esterase/lipase family protein [Thaumarchaeota archaeon]|nr:GDSL-type esterase/lipase family protein [Nitrososphaerota archaeon]
MERPPNGEGNEESQYSYWIMMEHPGWVVLNRGVNGQRSDEILRRFQRDVLGESPGYVIILGGVNDIYQGRDVESIRGNLEGMYKMAVESKILPVSCTVLPYNTMTSKAANNRRILNTWIRDHADKNGLPFCDTSEAVASAQNPDRLEGTPDGLHPDVRGYKKMGEALASVIEANKAAIS